MATPTKEDVRKAYEDVKRAYDDLDDESKVALKDIMDFVEEDIMDFVEEESEKAGITDSEDDAKPDKKKKVVAYLPLSLLFLIPAVVFLIAGNLVGAIVTLIVADVYAGLTTAQMMEKIHVLEAGHEAMRKIFRMQVKINLELSMALKMLEEKKGIDNEA